MIELFDTLSGTRREFTPLKPKTVGIYTCGPTVYYPAHIGNLRSYVFADTLHRLFVTEGFTVKHLINITDVGHLTDDGDDGEDKVEVAARREKKTAAALSAEYSELFFKDLTALNIKIAEYSFPKATDHIAEQIALIEKLLAKGLAYQISDGLYFDTGQYPDYENPVTEKSTKSSRIKRNPEKKNPRDFALWKFSQPADKREQEWPSPFGTGFPGWHIECSAMSMKYLGETFDIHTGGADHIPIHHINERAQAEAVTGKPLANYWLHNAFVVTGEAKMAKSAGNFLTLDDIKEKGHHPLALRYLYLGAHYRQKINFSLAALAGAEVALLKLAHFLIENNHTAGGQVNDAYRQKYQAVLADDLNTPQALPILWQLIADEQLSVADKCETLLNLDHYLGLGLDEINTPEPSKEVKELIQKREQARENTDWAEADRLRAEIAKTGLIVKDTPTGPILLPKSLEMILPT
ncbi:MAG: cysteine--tRNA ligase [Candidatus Paceibacterota bacterium]